MNRSRAENDNRKGWCDCAWDFSDGARCTTCGCRIPDIEFANSNPFDVLSKHGRACNVRKARKALRAVH